MLFFPILVNYCFRLNTLSLYMMVRKSHWMVVVQMSCETCILIFLINLEASPHPMHPQSRRASNLETKHPQSSPLCLEYKRLGPAAGGGSLAASPGGPSPTCRTGDNVGIVSK